MAKQIGALLKKCQPVAKRIWKVIGMLLNLGKVVYDRKQLYHSLSEYCKKISKWVQDPNRKFKFKAKSFAKGAWDLFVEVMSAVVDIGAFIFKYNPA